MLQCGMWFSRILQFTGYYRTAGVLEIKQLANCGNDPKVGLLLMFRTYKVKASLKLMCPGCRFVKRKGKLRVVCSVKARHKQRQG